MKSRKLVLKREALTELATSELGSVVGGTHVGCPLTHLSLDVGCPTLDVACPTNPVMDCINTLQLHCIMHG